MSGDDKLNINTMTRFVFSCAPDVRNDFVAKISQTEDVTERSSGFLRKTQRSLQPQQLFTSVNRQPVISAVNCETTT